MSWTAVAKKDFQDAGRSKLLWGLTALFVLFMAGMAYLYAEVLTSGGDQSVAALGLLLFLASPVALLVPLTGLIVGHKAIAGEVESGSVKLLLSLPHSRRDAVVGKAVGRAAVLSLSVVVGVVVAAVVVLGLYDSFDVGSYVAFAALTLLFGAAYVAIGVAISASTTSGSRATILAVSFFVVFELLWSAVRMGVWYLLNGTLSPPMQMTPSGPVTDAPGWYHLFGWLSPSGAYTATLAGYLPEQTYNFAASFPDGVPFYLQPWVAVLILVAWLVVPPALGYLRFRGFDL